MTRPKSRADRVPPPSCVSFLQSSYDFVTSERRLDLLQPLYLEVPLTLSRRIVWKAPPMDGESLQMLPAVEEVVVGSAFYDDVLEIAVLAYPLRGCSDLLIAGMIFAVLLSVGGLVSFQGYIHA